VGKSATHKRNFPSGRAAEGLHGHTRTVFLQQPKSNPGFRPIGGQAGSSCWVKDSDTFLNLFDDGLFGLLKQFLQLISPMEPDIWFQQVPEWLHAFGHAEGI
jgi:hypothetical protein